MTSLNDPAADALDRMAVAADRSADQERDVARRARELSGRRRRGASAGELVRAGAVTTIIAAVRAASREVLAAAQQLQAALAHGLAHEGHTTRQIGEHLGVSHQHVSALRRRAP